MLIRLIHNFTPREFNKTKGILFSTLIPLLRSFNLFQSSVRNEIMVVK